MQRQSADSRQELSNEKLKSILSFLDEVETKDKLDSIDQAAIEPVCTLPLCEVYLYCCSG